MVRQGESSATETLWSDLASRSSERERPRDHGDLNKTLVHTPSSLVLSRRPRRRRCLVTVPCFHG